MAAELTTPLAVALFEAYSRNCGHNPDEHYDRNAAEQWMTQALDECGVAELIEADKYYDDAQFGLARARYNGDPLDQWVKDCAAADIRRAAALASVQGGAA